MARKPPGEVPFGLTGQEQTLEGWRRQHGLGPREGACGRPGEDAEQVGPVPCGRGCRGRQEGLGRPVL